MYIHRAKLHLIKDRDFTPKTVDGSRDPAAVSPLADFW